MVKFDGKNVAEQIARYGDGDTRQLVGHVHILLQLFSPLRLNSSPQTRFYHTNYVRRFMLKRPFHRGTKDKQNEYKVCVVGVHVCW